MTEPGADEVRMRTILRQKEVGPDAIPPKPTARPKDWLDDILDSPAPTPVEESPAEKPAKPGAAPAQEAVAKPKRAKKRKRRRRNPAAPRSAWDTRPPTPRQSLVEAWDGVPYRMKWLAYHGSAAYLGWSIGLVDYATYVTAWIADTGSHSTQAIFWYAVGGATFLLYRCTRTWWWPVAWLAAVPATSTVAGVLLYGTPNP